MDSVTEALKQFLGDYIVAVAILVIGLVWIVWWLSSKYHSVKAKVEEIDNMPCEAHDGTLARLSERLEANSNIMGRIEDRLAALPCSSHSERHDRHEERLNNTDALLHKMEGQLELLVNNSIMKSTEKIRSRSGHTFSAKHSPRVLNQNGEALLNECGGKEFLDKNMHLFIDRIRKMQPKTALDVENLAIAVMQSATIEDIFNPIKDWVYNAPVRKIINSDGSTSEIEVSLEDIVFVLSLPVRDEYLEQYPM